MKEPKIKNLKINKAKTAQIRELANDRVQKIKITINFDSDLLEIVKKRATQSSIPYQTLINKLLREALDQFPTTNIEERIKNLEKEIKNLKKKIA